MQNEFIIEEVTSFSPTIADAVRNLTQQLDSHYQELTDADIQSILSSSHTSLFLAREVKTETIAGMVTLVSYRIPYKRKGILEDLVVDKNYRGKGLGETLLQAAITKAKEIGVVSLMLTSQPSREAANKLYQRLGFQLHNTNVYRVQL